MTACAVAAVWAGGQDDWRMPSSRLARPELTTLEATHLAERRRYTVRRWPLSIVSDVTGTSRAEISRTLLGAWHGGSDPTDVHLSVGLGGPRDSPLSAAGDVVGLQRPEQTGRAVQWVSRILSQFPGCLVTAARDTTGGCVAGARNGARIVAFPDRAPGRILTRTELWGMASFLHSQLVLGQPWQTLRSVVLSTARGRVGPADTACERRRLLVLPLADFTREERLAA